MDFESRINSLKDAFIELNKNSDISATEKKESLTLLFDKISSEIAILGPMCSESDYGSKESKKIERLETLKHEMSVYF